METTETPHTQLKRTPPQKKIFFKNPLSSGDPELWRHLVRARSQLRPRRGPGGHDGGREQVLGGAEGRRRIPEIAGGAGGGDGQSSGLAAQKHNNR